jgi:hypothetical protein
VIRGNRLVHSLKGWWRLFGQSYWPKEWGADGYRPVTMLAFAVEWTIGNGASWVFHAANILLYCAITVAVFWLASALLPITGAWVAAALFAVHPVHVEAVANTVGQSELLVALLCTVAVGMFVRRRSAPTSDPGGLDVRAKVAICVCYAIALFAKEHAIVLPAVLIAAEALVVKSARPLGERLTRLRPFGLVLLLIAVSYLWARTAVKGGEIAGFQPFIVFQALNLSHANRVLTMIGVVPEWVRLFLWPAQLSLEYSPPDVDIAQGLSVSQLPGALLLIGILGLAATLYRRKNPGPTASFGIVWLCITLLPVSNFIIPAGIILAERTLFLPSIGAMLAVGAAVAWLRERMQLRAPSRALVANAAAGVALAAVLVAAAWQSAARTRVWKDNDTLFRQAIVDAPNSYRAHYMLGAWLFERDRLSEGEHHYRQALHLFPYDPYMAFNLGQQYQRVGMCDPALTMYRWTYETSPEFEVGRSRFHYAKCLLRKKEYAEARRQALYGIQLGGASLKLLRGIIAAADSGLMKSERKTHPRSGTDPVKVGVAQDGKVRSPMQNTGAER